MKLILGALLLLAASQPSFAGVAASPQPSASPSPALLGVPVYKEPPLVPNVTQLTTVPEVSAPPVWAQDLMVTAGKLPIIGPVVSKVMLYLGIVSSILTLFCGFLISAIGIVSQSLKYAGLENAVATLGAFQNGKFMYYLKFFSLFNAQKPENAKA